MDSVWSSLPPINVSSSNNHKPIVLTVASMDSASFFRDKSFGADSPVSVRFSYLLLLGLSRICLFTLLFRFNAQWLSNFQGLVALLGAVDALSRVDGFSNLKKQVPMNKYKCQINWVHSTHQCAMWFSFISCFCCLQALIPEPYLALSYVLALIALCVYSKWMQLVFLVLTGETWGYLGSRRFLHELDLHSDAVAGLSNSQIETVTFIVVIQQIW